MRVSGVIFALRKAVYFPITVMYGQTVAALLTSTTEILRTFPKNTVFKVRTFICEPQSGEQRKIRTMCDKKVSAYAETYIAERFSK